MKKVLNGVFTILKIISWMWIVLVTIASFTMGFDDGQYNLGTRIVMILVLGIVPIIFLIWRFKADKEIRAKKRYLKLEKQKEEQRVKDELQEIKIKKEEEENARIRKERELEEMKKYEPVISENKQIYEFKRTGVAPINVIMDGNWIAIDRKGMYNTLMHGLDGIKKINIKNITAVQFREGTSIAAGYIQLVLLGSTESKGGFRAANADENTIMFGASYNELARKLVNVIETKIDELQNATFNTQTIIQKHEQTVAQQIKEFKDLLDSDIITQEEFNKKKAELLG